MNGTPIGAYLSRRPPLGRPWAFSEFLEIEEETVVSCSAIWALLLSGACRLSMSPTLAIKTQVELVSSVPSFLLSNVMQVKPIPMQFAAKRIGRSGLHFPLLYCKDNS